MSFGLSWLFFLEAFGEVLPMLLLFVFQKMKISFFQEVIVSNASLLFHGI